MNWDPGRNQLNWGLLTGTLGPPVRMLRNIMTSRVVAALAPFGLPSGSLSMMVLMAANRGCSQTELARQTGVTKSAVVAILDELEKRGLAQRKTAPEDRRRNELTLTAKGALLLADMERAATAQEAPLREEFTEAERDLLLAMIGRAYDALERDSVSRSEGQSTNDWR